MDCRGNSHGKGCPRQRILEVTTQGDDNTNNVPVLHEEKTPSTYYPVLCVPAMLQTLPEGTGERGDYLRAGDCSKRQRGRETTPRELPGAAKPAQTQPTQGHQHLVVAFHDAPVHFLLSRVQARPLLPAEPHCHILEPHRDLQHRLGWGTGQRPRTTPRPSDPPSPSVAPKPPYGDPRVDSQSPKPACSQQPTGFIPISWNPPQLPQTAPRSPGLQWIHPQFPEAHCCPLRSHSSCSRPAGNLLDSHPVS